MGAPFRYSAFGRTLELPNPSVHSEYYDVANWGKIAVHLWPLVLVK